MRPGKPVTIVRLPGRDVRELLRGFARLARMNWIE